MKRILLSIAVLAAGFTANAQSDTITSHMAGTPVLLGSGISGYVSGNNDYNDIGKYQRFDATHGIMGTGLMTEVLLWIPVKDDNGGSFEVTVIDFTGGTTGTALATETVMLVDVDTNVASLTPIGGLLAYNVAVTLTTPVVITGASDILVGVNLPLTAGDTTALVSSTDGDFADALTHTWEQWSDNSFVSLKEPQPDGWDLSIAFAVFPIINYPAGLNATTIEANVYPNPANDVLNVSASTEVSTVSIIGMDGKVIISNDVNATTTAVNVADLTAGVYIYEVVTANGIVRNTFVKN